MKLLLDKKCYWPGEKGSKRVAQGKAAEANAVDYRGLIADVLDGLLMMTEGNWEEKREELAELLRPVAG